MHRIAYVIMTVLMLTGCRELANRTEINKPIRPEDLKTLTTTPAPLPPRLNKAPSETSKKPLYPPNFYKTVSISVTENIPLKPILSELSRQVKIDLQLDRDIQSQVVFQATDRPFIEIIEDLCELTDLRFRIKNKALRIERDTPYSENYNIQFLNLSRNSQNKISVATDVFTKNGIPNQTASHNDNGSNSSVSVETKNDFWSELETNLKVLLAQDNEKQSKQKSNKSKESSTYSVHKQGGLITIYAPEKTHKRIKDYLTKLKRASSSEVLIEAKIIEVTLKEEYRSGIDWRKMGKHNDLQLNALFGATAQKSKFLDPSDAQQSMFSFGATGTTFSAILNALQEFGHSRTLSSPRLTVMNNQTAILKVAQNQVYFRMNYDKQFSTTVNLNNVSVSSDIQTVPIGLVMSVQPSIDPDTGEIILFLRPSISRLNKSIPDPAVDIAYSSNSTTSGDSIPRTPSMIPVVEVREIDSVLRLQNGEIGVMGGLMEVRCYQDSSKMPGLGDLHFIKELVSSTADGDTIVELVIILKATITDSAPTPDAADVRLTTDYVADSRKWAA
jgi:MSHA type pilus biogenesis protein MshL